MKNEKLPAVGVTVKICGITNLEDAEAAVNAGADALGFMFFRGSSRAISVETAARIAAALPPGVARVGVFVNPTADEVLEAMGRCQLNMLQFHGEESPEFCVQFGLLTMKAFRLRNAESLSALPNYATDAWLVDAYHPVERGGTGTACDWNLALEATRLGRPIFLAGGLTPENVSEAIRCVRPFGVDVSSGVESAPGRKDHEKVRRFIQAAKQALP